MSVAAVSMDGGGERARGERGVELPGVAEAQLTAVHRHPSFLSAAEIETLTAKARALKPQCGKETRYVDQTAAGSFERWCCWFLHTEGAFASECPALLERVVALARRADTEQGWGLLGGVAELSVRCVEYHEMQTGGKLADPRHHDEGSLCTIDIMLAKPGEEFEGAQFATLEAGGELKPREFAFGDAMVFVSHKYHCVAPVTRGDRRVLIVELWDGGERTCPHRCCERVAAECDGAAAVDKDRQDMGWFLLGQSGLNMEDLGAAMEAAGDEESSDEEKDPSGFSQAERPYCAHCAPFPCGCAVVGFSAGGAEGGRVARPPRALPAEDEEEEDGGDCGGGEGEGEEEYELEASGSARIFNVDGGAWAQSDGRDSYRRSTISGELVYYGGAVATARRSAGGKAPRRQLAAQLPLKEEELT